MGIDHKLSGYENSIDEFSRVKLKKILDQVTLQVEFQTAIDIDQWLKNDLEANRNNNNVISSLQNDEDQKTKIEAIDYEKILIDLLAMRRKEQNEQLKQQKKK